VPGRSTPGGRPEQAEAVVEQVGQVPGVEGAQPGGGQLQRQRQAVQAPADPARLAAAAVVTAKDGSAARARSASSRTASDAPTSAAASVGGTGSGATS
jgi:hypothetical protein